MTTAREELARAWAAKDPEAFQAAYDRRKAELQAAEDARAPLRAGNKTAAQIAAGWRARAAGLRHSDDVADLAAAIAFEQCARELMTELDGMLSG